MFEAVAGLTLECCGAAYAKAHPNVLAELLLEKEADEEAAEAAAADDDEGGDYENCILVGDVGDRVDDSTRG